jgi:hypothetical protein
MICFNYDETKYPEGPKPYFMSFPVLNFIIKGENDSIVYFKWFPSEYLYRDRKDLYCLAAEPYDRSNEIMMGGTIMR